MNSVAVASKYAVELLQDRRQKGEGLLSTVLSSQAHSPPQPAALSRQLLLVLADQACALA